MDVKEEMRVFTSRLEGAGAARDAPGPSGLYEAFPRLRIILGHMGEGIPFWLWCIDNRWEPMEKRNTPKPPGYYSKEHFY
jgi:hypothetical protein